MAFLINLPRPNVILLIITIFFTLTTTGASAQMLTAFGFGTDLQSEGPEPDFVATGLAVSSMTLTRDGVVRGPLAYDEGSVGRGAFQQGGWSPETGGNFFETVITTSEPGTSFQITNIDFDYKTVGSGGHVLGVAMIANGEAPVLVYNLAGGGPPIWRAMDSCSACFLQLHWPPMLERTDLQSLVIRVLYDPISTEANFGIDEFIVWGQVLVTSAVGVQPPMAHDDILHQNQPNPFNPRTSISFSLERAGAVTLKVYDLQGREVRTLMDGHREEGAHQVIWDGRDRSGQASASGIYVYRIQTQDGVQSRRMTLLQ